MTRTENNHAPSKHTPAHPVVDPQIDMEDVTRTGDVVWSVPAWNEDIVRDYLHVIYPRFAAGAADDASTAKGVSDGKGDADVPTSNGEGDAARDAAVQNALWVVRGVMISTGCVYNPSAFNVYRSRVGGEEEGGVDAGGMANRLAHPASPPITSSEQRWPSWRCWRW